MCRSSFFKLLGLTGSSIASDSLHVFPPPVGHKAKAVSHSRTQWKHKAKAVHQPRGQWKHARKAVSLVTRAVETQDTCRTGLRREFQKRLGGNQRIWDQQWQNRGDEMMTKAVMR